MTTTRTSTAIAAAIFAAIVALITVPGRSAFADPAKPAPAPAAPAGDKKADKPAAPAAGEKKEVVSEAEAKRFVDFFDKLVGIVVANQQDCPKMAAGVNGHIDANQPLVKELNDPKNSNKELPPASKQHIEQKVREELTPAITKKCASDKAVTTAFGRMNPSHQ